MPRFPLSLLLSAALLGAVSGSALTAHAAGPTATDNEARRVNAAKLSKPITIDLTDARLEDVVTFIRDFSGAEIEPVWEEGDDVGLDKDQRITISVKNIAVITLIERVLEKARSDFSTSTWQFSTSPGDGAIEIGPRSRLNRKAFLKLYDVQDLIFVIPDFANAPQLDLDQVLNQGGQGGGGGGGSVFGQDSQGAPVVPTEDELAQRITDIIVENVEPDQWDVSGGDGATIRLYQGHLMVRAPDYIHRQLSGYPFDLGRPGAKSRPERVHTAR